MVYVTLNQTYTGWKVKKVSESGAELKSRGFKRKADAQKYAKRLKQKVVHAY